MERVRVKAIAQQRGAQGEPVRLDIFGIGQPVSAKPPVYVFLSAAQRHHECGLPRGRLHEAVSVQYLAPAGRRLAGRPGPAIVEAFQAVAVHVWCKTQFGNNT